MIIPGEIGSEITVYADEYNYSGHILEYDEDGILLDVDKRKIFVPWEEVLWIGENVKIDPEGKKIKDRSNRWDTVGPVVIFIVAIVAALIVRWLW